MYSLEEKILQPNEYIVKENQYADRIIFIEKGVVELITVFEGNIFVMERLK